MSAESIQNNLNKAYKTVAKALGRPFEIYRPTSLNDPLRAANYIDEQLASFSLDESYKKTSKNGLSLWLTWVDARLENLFTLQDGDILYNSQTNEAYIMVGMTPMLTNQAIKANDYISISRAGSGGYGDDDGSGFAPSNTAQASTYANNVPCQILNYSAYGSLGYVPTSSNVEDTLPRYEVYLWDVNSELLQRDVITGASGQQMEIQTITQTDIGTKLTCRGIPK